MLYLSLERILEEFGEAWRVVDRKHPHHGMIYVWNGNCYTVLSKEVTIGGFVNQTTARKRPLSVQIT